MKYFLPLAVLLLVFASCHSNKDVRVDRSGAKVTLVNPFIGTGAHGHTFPGATSPFGMVQLSPDTRLSGWDGCSGYHFSDDTVYGFSHTHLSGTGVSDYGDILVMPVRSVTVDQQVQFDYADYAVPFSHDDEEARAGYYRVGLPSIGTSVQLTTSPRVGWHHYAFEDADAMSMVVDLEHRDRLIDCHLRQVDSVTLSGYRHSDAWATDQRLFFAIRFSTPIKMAKAYGSAKYDKDTKWLIQWDDPTAELELQVALSPVDEVGALRNLTTEVDGDDFTSALQNNQAAWEAALSRIDYRGSTAADDTVFYTALYHTMIAPNLYSDVDGRYRGMDQQIHHSGDPQYTVFSLWDTYRATHPLYTLIDSQRTVHFVRSMLNKYDQGGKLPIWDLSACYTGCMIGYHGASVISDAYVKGIRAFDLDKAATAVQHSATRDHLGLKSYQAHGFIPVEEEAESVSKTLEYSYDDWCISQMLAGLGDTALATTYNRRSLSYRNVYSPTDRLFRGRAYNFWYRPFEPAQVNSNYTEANAWQYGFAPVQDLGGWIDLLGGKAVLDDQLDALFAADSETTGRHQVDITGLVGQYAHGNEPSHHIAYLYNYADKSHKTQSMVRHILDTQYSTRPDGISGNEDCGQMSAWYVFSALGFYPVTPGSTKYVFGSPRLDAASIHWEDGKRLDVVCKPAAADHPYIKAVYLNGQRITQPWIDHHELKAGGTLRYEMSDRPSTAFDAVDLTAWQVDDRDFVASPYLVGGGPSITPDMAIGLGHADTTVQLYYALDDKPYARYDGNKLFFDKSAMICCYARDGSAASDTICTQLMMRDTSMSIVTASTVSPLYDGGHDQALVDGLRGGKDFRTGGWQGYEGQDLEVAIDRGSTTTISTVRASFLQDENSWIFMPTEVIILSAADGKHYEEVGRTTTTTDPHAKGTIIEVVEVNIPPTTDRHIVVLASGQIKCPAWHKGADYDGKAWVFVDEIWME